MTAALFLALASALLAALALQRRGAAGPSASASRLAPRAEPLPASNPLIDDDEITLLLSAEDLQDLQDLKPQPALESRSKSSAEKRAAEASAAENSSGPLPDSLLAAILEVNQADIAPPPTAKSTRMDAEIAAHRGELKVRLSYEPEALELSSSVRPMHLLAGGDSDRGHRRKKNEDNFLFSSEQGLFVVADGMGGYAGGSIASGLAVETLRLAFEKPEPGPPSSDEPTLPQPARELASAVQRANQVVFDVARSREELSRMGTTLVALRFALGEQRLYVVHAGDSRCYRLRQRELRQLTTDHVMSQLGVEGRQGAHLFNAIGIEAEAKLDVLVDKPIAGDTYLLCSDGLSKMVSDEVIRAVLIAEEDVESAVYTLIEHANDAGGRDNVTVVLAKVQDGAGSPSASQSWSVGG